MGIHLHIFISAHFQISLACPVVVVVPAVAAVSDLVEEVEARRGPNHEEVEAKGANAGLSGFPKLTQHLTIDYRHT